MSHVSRVLLLSAGLSILGCQGDDSPRLDYSKYVFEPFTRSISIEVDYMKGAEPFVGKTDAGLPYWKLLRHNLTALLPNRDDLEIHIPQRLDEMQEIPAENRFYDSEDIIQLARQYRDLPQIDGEHLSVYVIFLDGNFWNNAQAKPEWTGISLEKTGIIAISKASISTLHRDVVEQALIEQLTLIHEMGHVIGLVNVGIPMQIEHQDKAQGHHCTNDRCIMHFKHQEGQEVLWLLGASTLGSDAILFGRVACLM